VNGVLAILLIVAGAGAAAYAIATVLVAAADLAGLCWSASREAKRHAGDAPAFTATAHRRNA
jgi:hypothetical protein